MQDRGDVGQIVEHLEGVVDILCRCFRGSTETFATRPLEAVHRSSVTPPGGIPRTPAV